MVDLLQTRNKDLRIEKVASTGALDDDVQIDLVEFNLELRLEVAMNHNRAAHVHYPSLGVTCTKYF